MGREDNRKRLSSSYQEEEIEKMNRISAALGIAPTTLQTELVRQGINNPIVMDQIISKYRAKARFHIFTSYHNDTLQFSIVDKIKVKGKK
ncbi:hypothetical protein [Ammoniphilus resinae]|uniref:Uncharacterized protein n=1 Tax=Ammoniphilus resinae TaxID=861532 RepID=A0ABS4GW44_9BACL|nr:hypothetical protein [Ammoniphilus resinae]MBP1934317.1 hypothetical protein [Ammoniphilus resinae]